MKINSVSLLNIGPYLKNTFDFTTDDVKNVILVGGNNGAGKTTLFKSIKYCLYGSKALGYEINNSKYMHEIKNLINVNNVLSNNSYAEIQISISLENSTNYNDYTIVRKWEIKNDKIQEYPTVFSNKKELVGEEASNFESMLCQVIPPDLFNFYFFNGEKIFEELFDENNLNNFKSSFLKIVGLDTLDLLIDNFEKHAADKIINKKVVANYETISRKYNEILQEKSYLENQIIVIDQKIKSAELEMEQLHKKYSRHKVLPLKEKRQLEIELNEVTERKDKLRKYLKDCANNYLPFLLLRDELRDLLKKIKETKNSFSKSDLIEALDTKKVKSFLKESNLKTGADKFVNKLAEIVCSDSKSNILILSSNDKSYLIEQITNLLSEDNKNEIIKSEDEYYGALERIKKIKDLLESNSGERNEEYQELESNYYSDINSLQKKKSAIYDKLNPVLEKFNEVSLLYKKERDIYEDEIKKESVSSISYNASISFKKLRDKLLLSRISKLKKLFDFNFKNLINKDDLISGIKVEKDLTIYPYKTVLISQKGAKNMLKDCNKNFIVENYGEDGYEKMAKSKKFPISVDKKVIGTLSAGESQIYVIALYMSMLSLSRVNIPLIIDTPFGRIDEDHRMKSVKNFLKKINNQMIILSTDEEIVGPFYKEISKNVTSTYKLDNKNSITTVKKGYFSK